MRFSYAIIALMSLANALPTESNIEQRAASLAQRNVEDRGVADAAYFAEIDARAEGLKLEERKKKKNATAKAAAKAAAAAAGTARSLDIEDRGIADAAYLAEVDARAEGLHLEERKKKKNATAKAAAKAAAAAGTARSLDIEDRSIADAAYLAEVDARAEGLHLEERKKKKNNATANAAKAATRSAADMEDRSIADAAYLAEVDARADGLKLEERKGKKNKTAKAAAAANARQRSMNTVSLSDEVE
ncbi:hypothetical protein N0V82_008542 [Gnomoniopsis sp. IMI 355080]|nr:hypothetical protein N0V82_008542 [Gnomoniopsis sp. IMI 355080]